MSALPHDHLSFSQINQFAGYGGCEYAWAHKHVYKTPVTRKKGIPLLLGSAFDAAASAGCNAKITTGENPDPDLLGEAFLNTWRDEWMTGEYEASEDTPTTMINMGVDASMTYGRDWIPRTHPVETQKRVEMAFDEVDWTLVGYVDLIEAAATPIPSVRIIDHKATASSSTKYEAGADLQLGLYAAALTVLGEEVSEVEFRTARVLKTKHEVVSSAAPSTIQDRQRSLQILSGVGAKMEDACSSGRFLPTAFLTRSWKCSSRYCDVYEVCEFGARARVQG